MCKEVSKEETKYFKKRTVVAVAAAGAEFYFQITDCCLLSLNLHQMHQLVEWAEPGGHLWSLLQTALLAAVVLMYFRQTQRTHFVEAVV
jgi:hypothetical protein